MRLVRNKRPRRIIGAGRPLPSIACRGSSRLRDSLATNRSITATLNPARAFRAPPDAAAVVVDQYRASSVMVAALEAGAASLRPCLEPDDARALAARLGPASLLGGERGCVRIPGFDLGNSPAEYTPERVGGRDIVFTTTNGTRALDAAAGAREILVACLANRAAVARALSRTQRIALRAAGTEGEPSLEDTLAVGAVIDALAGVDGAELDDGAAIALAAWRSLPDHGPATIRAAMAPGRGARNLAGRFDADLDWCSRLDTHAVVPALDPSDGALRPR
jgi:2-phosphosulfolactate phosphatase